MFASACASNCVKRAAFDLVRRPLNAHKRIDAIARATEHTAGERIDVKKDSARTREIRAKIKSERLTSAGGSAPSGEMKRAMPRPSDAINTALARVPRAQHVAPAFVSRVAVATLAERPAVRD